MISQSLIDYIKKSREAGMGEYFIRQALINVGWDRDLLDVALDSEEAWPESKRVDFLSSRDLGDK